MSLLSKHPLLVFGLGVAAGIYAHKHRREIIEAFEAGTAKAVECFESQSKNVEELLAMKHH